jgi:hypothetical protein
MTLAESAKYSQEKMYPKVVEEILKTSPLLNKVPFIEVNGTALRVDYEDESNPSTVAFYGANEQIAGSEGLLLQKDFALTRLIGDAQVDNLLLKSRSNPIDIMAEQVRLKSKALAHKFEDCTVYGGTGNEFNGLHSSSILATAQTIKLGSVATGAALQIEHLDRAMDLVSVGGPPDLIVMNRNILRRLSAYLRTVGSYQSERDEYGNLWVSWQGVPIAASDFITQTEAIATDATYSAKTGGVTSTVFVLRLGAGDGLCGIQSGSIKTEKFGNLENFDGSKVRLKWYCGVALFQWKAIAAITGITDAAVTA